MFEEMSLPDVYIEEGWERQEFKKEESTLVYLRIAQELSELKREGEACLNLIPDLNLEQEKEVLHGLIENVRNIQDIVYAMTTFLHNITMLRNHVAKLKSKVPAHRDPCIEQDVREIEQGKQANQIILEEKIKQRGWLIPYIPSKPFHCTQGLASVLLKKGVFGAGKLLDAASVDKLTKVTYERESRIRNKFKTSL